MKQELTPLYESPCLEIVLLHPEGFICDFSNRGTEKVTLSENDPLDDSDFE